MRPKAGGRPTIKPKTVEEGMLRLQRLSEKWSALYQPPKKSDSAETSSTSLSEQVALLRVLVERTLWSRGMLAAGRCTTAGIPPEAFCR